MFGIWQTSAMHINSKSLDIGIGMVGILILRILSGLILLNKIVGGCYI